MRPFPENSLKKHERILGTGDCRECSRKCVFSFLLTQNRWNTPKMRSVGEHFCRNVCTALRSIPWKPAVQNLPRSFFLLSLVTFLPFSFSKEKEKESNEKITWFKFLSLYPSYTILIFQTVPQIKIWNRFSTKRPSYINKLFASECLPALQALACPINQNLK